MALALSRHVASSFAAALASALAWGVSAFVGAAAARRFGPWITSLGTQVAGLVVVAALAVPVGLAGLPGIALRDIAALAGIGVLIASLNLASYQLLRLGAVSIVYPILASNAAVVSILAIVLLDESLSAVQTAALVLVTAGVALTAWGRAEDEGAPVRYTPSSASPRVVGAAALVAIASGFGVFCLARYTQSVGWYLPVAIERTAQVIVFTSLLAAGLPAWSSLLGHRRTWWVLLAVSGLLDGLAIALYAFAYEKGPTAVVATTTSSFVVIPVLLGIILLRERPGPRQIGGVASVLVGLVALSG